jgi:hypothetical protein
MGTHTHMHTCAHTHTRQHTLTNTQTHFDTHPSGITPEFGSYLVELVADKLEVEYMNWLQRVRDFLEAKPK